MCYEPEAKPCSLCHPTEGPAGIPFQKERPTQELRSALRAHRADLTVETAACKAAFKKGGEELKTCFRQRERKREGEELRLRASEAKRRALQQNMLEH